MPAERKLLFMTDLAMLQTAIGLRFKDVSLLELSLIHSSYVNENPDLAPVSNERLEFLGDAVLGFVFATRLYNSFGQSPEGELTRLRSRLVRGSTLARAAAGIGLGEYLYLGKGEEAGGGRSKPANLAGALEALIGAAYLDQGATAADVVASKLLGSVFAELTGPKAGTDYKSRLQEYVQASHQVMPHYRIVDTSGPDHARRFTAEVMLEDEPLGRGSGRSKKEAETEAARQALIRLEANFT
jgi:ribonuclease-3